MIGQWTGPWYMYKRAVRTTEKFLEFPLLCCEQQNPVRGKFKLNIYLDFPPLLNLLICKIKRWEFLNSIVPTLFLYVHTLHIKHHELSRYSIHMFLDESPKFS